MNSQAAVKTDTDSLINALRKHAPRCVIDSSLETRKARAHDRWPIAAKWSEEEMNNHTPLAVVRVGSARDVSQVLTFAGAHHIPVVPFGAGSGVVGGVVNQRGYLCIDLSGLNGKPELDAENGEVTVPSGVLGGDLEKILNEAGRRLPHYPQSLALASIGGLVATRSSGTFSSKYGNIENFVTSLEVVLPDGAIIHTQRSPRSSTGPSVAQMFVGSEGTLGIITAVTLRTLPLATSQLFRGVAFEGVGPGLNAVRQVLDSGLMPAVIRLYDEKEAVHIFEKSGIEPAHRTLLVLAFDGNPAVAAAEQAESLKITAALGGEDLGSTPGEIWEKTRYDAGWLDRGNAGEFDFADAIEIAAGWHTLEALHDKVLNAISPYADNAFAHYSHFYSNGGAIYFIFFIVGKNKQDAESRFNQVWDITMRTVLEHGGSISHHHGVGEARKHWMVREHGDSLRVLAKLKQALDPRAILSPGKMGFDEQPEAGK
ncbi:FAD-binding oxidoreductase [Sodalis ligni]|jgi:alkyldihydroxyacetonephosphate synthase|uniref:FAD-binding oxidoreductase n=1 Tax=Sodalis ligni TaxID=2697027 RepID=UPI00193F074D|nr:FAD-binding oxidoreductase [Sodalis ligni]QWA13002.1 FAD-binding oxidoreductase [Sodalis ligni]